MIGEILNHNLFKDVLLIGSISPGYAGCDIVDGFSKWIFSLAPLSQPNAVDCISTL